MHIMSSNISDVFFFQFVAMKLVQQGSLYIYLLCNGLLLITGMRIILRRPILFIVITKPHYEQILRLVVELPLSRQ